MQNYFSSSFVSCSRKSPAANISPSDPMWKRDAGFCLHGAHQLHPAVQGLQTVILEFNLKLSSCHRCQFSWVYMDRHRDCVKSWGELGSGTADPFWRNQEIREDSTPSWGTQGTESLHQTVAVNQRKRRWCLGEENGEGTGATGSRGCSVHRAGQGTAGSVSCALGTVPLCCSAPESPVPLPLFSPSGLCLTSLTHNRSKEKKTKKGESHSCGTKTLSGYCNISLIDLSI